MPFEDITLDGTQYNNIRKNKIRDRLVNKKLKIGGTKFTLGAKSRLLERFGVIGQTDFFNQSILVDSNITEDQTLVTILHEMIECINKKYYLELPHDLINALEVHLFETLTNNPIYLKELLQYAKRYSVDSEGTKEVKNRQA